MIKKAWAFENSGKLCYYFERERERERDIQRERERQRGGEKVVKASECLLERLRE